ncbi:MAG: ATP-binding cassette domain-containing protein, partial [Muribaculaceae bacterium]|nr:ATP-binding cassette domain-containing protein [Muribaculaceae bacterium]
SNPVTYIKAYDDIRALMADQPLAKQLDIPAGWFSFNTEGGRCEACKGEGVITIEMQFLADVTIECEECHGKRFKRDVLEVRYRGKNIADILDMTVDEAIAFFGADTADTTAMRIARRLRPLADVGLGYVRLGQSSSTLSGGENQRVKLAFYLSQANIKPQIFIFDEPTTGLHFHDISLLLSAFDSLIAMGHTLIVVEHNLDVIKTADYVIDLGPDGGDAGGSLVAAGTPEQVAGTAASITGHYLKEKLSAR